VNPIDILRRCGVIAVLRGIDSERMLPIAQALYEGGIKAVEVTLNHPDSIKSIALLDNEFGKDLLIGAGTVLNPDAARAAVSAGAKFIISPSLNLKTIETTKELGVVSIPGAYTPTEIVTAYENGADFVKVFPATALGPSFLKDMKGPLPHIPLIPTGGIHVGNAFEFLQAGAVAIGVGGSLVSASQKIDRENLVILKQRAQEFLNECEKAREQGVWSA
jgi:2-dehydro-3-deoxyphosphogluconate aldolase / (4S)-4-hydroxy-2-oxoglutarate aldolase